MTLGSRPSRCGWTGNCNSSPTPACSQTTETAISRLWAAFDPDAAGRLTGDGPEFQNGLRRTGASAKQTLNRSRRRHGGLILFPLPWVSHHWRQFRNGVRRRVPFPAIPDLLGLAARPASCRATDARPQFDFSPESVRDASRHVDERRETLGFRLPFQCWVGRTVS